MSGAWEDTDAIYPHGSVVMTEQVYVDFLPVEPRDYRWLLVCEECGWEWQNSTDPYREAEAESLAVATAEAHHCPGVAV